MAKWLNKWLHEWVSHPWENQGQENNTNNIKERLKLGGRQWNLHILLLSHLWAMWLISTSYCHFIIITMEKCKARKRTSEWKPQVTSWLGVSLLFEKGVQDWSHHWGVIGTEIGKQGGGDPWWTSGEAVLGRGGKNVLDRAKQSVLLECLNYGSQENTDSKVTEISTVVEEII